MKKEKSPYEKEERMKIADSIFIKMVIIGFILAFIIWKNPGVQAAIWAYSLTGLLAYLMFGFFFDRLKNPRHAFIFLRSSFTFGLILIVIFLISLTRVFDGPLGYLLSWPSLVSGIIIAIFSFFGMIAANNRDQEELFD